MLVGTQEMEVARLAIAHSSCCLGSNLSVQLACTGSERSADAISANVGAADVETGTCVAKLLLLLLLRSEAERCAEGHALPGCCVSKEGPLPPCRSPCGRGQLLLP